MSIIYSIGEALIDFIPKQKGVQLKEVTEFERVPGGAPANVAAAVAKLGGKSSFVSKLGIDAFGDVIIDALSNAGVDTSKVLRTSKANTGLAFVSLTKDGEREFSFYRKPSADMLLNESEVADILFNEGDILHFCSVDLIDAPVKGAHVKVIDNALKEGVLVSFDPNVRLPLWESASDCKKAILEFIPKTHILKISDDELEFITGIMDEKSALESLFVGNVELVIYTMGKKGARFITQTKEVDVDAFNISVEDTTGAGDSFIGAVLYMLQDKRINREMLSQLSNSEIVEILTFANACAAIVSQKKGVISILPSKKEVENMIEKRAKPATKIHV